MKHLIIAVLVVVFLNVQTTQAFEDSYLVHGLDDAGHRLSGSVYSIPGNLNVNGNLTDHEGRIHTFYGKVRCDALITGETDDGYRATLYIVN